MIVQRVAGAPSPLRTQNLKAFGADSLAEVLCSQNHFTILRSSRRRGHNGFTIFFQMRSDARQYTAINIDNLAVHETRCV